MIVDWYEKTETPWKITYDKLLYVWWDTKKWLKKNYLKGGGMPLFTSVEIETLNRCNNDCPFCPVNCKADSREYKKMDKKVFEKIIDQLGELNYSGRLSLSSNNEPFLDTRIIEFAEYARNKCPNAFLYLYTNGTMLNLERLLQIIPFLNRICIDNYSDEKALSDENKRIADYCKEGSELYEKVEIHIRKKNEILTTRGGQAPNNGRKRN